MIHEIIPVGMLACNCSIVGDESTGEALIIDPGDEIDRILEILKRHNLRATQIIATHAHIDHVGGIDKLRRTCGAPVLLHEDDHVLYQNLSTQAAWLGVEPPGVAAPPGDYGLTSMAAWRRAVDRRDIPLVVAREGQTIRCGELAFEVLHTPGHSPGSISLHRKGGEGQIFSGDTLFEGSIGRTDLWGGSMEEILRSIKERLLVFDDATRVFPGHGAATTIGHEREMNPFLKNL